MSTEVQNVNCPACEAQGYTEEICSGCSGCGQGYTEFSACSSCGGGGSHRTKCETCDGEGWLDNDGVECLWEQLECQESTVQELRTTIGQLKANQQKETT